MILMVKVVYGQDPPPPAPDTTTSTTTTTTTTAGPFGPFGPMFNSFMNAAAQVPVLGGAAQRVQSTLQGAAQSAGLGRRRRSVDDQALRPELTSDEDLHRAFRDANDKIKIEIRPVKVPPMKVPTAHAGFRPAKRPGREDKKDD